jgi:hypothetical protein
MSNWRFVESSSVWVNLVAVPANFAIATVESALWGSAWCFLAIFSASF